MLLEKLENVFAKFSKWWEGEPMDRPCLEFSFRKPGKPAPSVEDLNDYWPSCDDDPNFEGLVDKLIEEIEANYYFGETIPAFPHQWGGRGIPMIIGAYLGGRVDLRKETVWVKPVIDDWREFKLRFDEENIWFKRSFKFFKLAIEKSNDRYMVWLPDFGDALTVLSLLRGVDRLLIDLVENREAVLEARDKFIQLWPEFHKRFWELYSKEFPGDMSWLAWAPGKTYVCQCDFSTMISPQMFIEFVVPEIEAMGKYLDYIVWHLDGPGELKHLDILLDLQEVKVIQWNPGFGNPPCISPKWFPMLKRIQDKGKGLVVSAENEGQVKLLLKEISSKGLFIRGGFTGRTEEEALEYIETVSKLSGSFAKGEKL